jgi:hypothetical protein
MATRCGFAPAHGLAALGRARALHLPGADPNDNAGDRNYLVLAKPNVIMNDTRLRGLAVAGSDPAGRRSPHNHAQIARNLRQSLRNAAAGARLIQADGVDSKSAADLATSLADALEELHRLKRGLDRRVRRDALGYERGMKSGKASGEVRPAGVGGGQCGKLLPILTAWLIRSWIRPGPGRDRSSPS